MQENAVDFIIGRINAIISNKTDRSKSAKALRKVYASNLEFLNTLYRVIVPGLVQLNEEKTALVIGMNENDDGDST